FMTGDTVYKTQSVEEGKYVVKPVAPTPQDETKEFAYWCSDAALTTEFSFTKTKPTGDLTLYAKFVPKEVPLTVRFFNGETELDNIEITSASPATLGVATADKGYVFIGWAAEEGAIEPEYFESELFTVEDAAEIAVDNEVKLYAVFKEADVKVAVWERYYLETETLKITKDAYIAYMEESGFDYLVEYRVYGDDAYHAVADFGAAINADGDIDVIIGSGANITSQGGVEVLAKSALLSEYDPNGAGRQAALVQGGDIAKNFYSFVTGIPNDFATVTLEDGVNENAFVLSAILDDAADYIVPEKEGFTFVGYAYAEGAEVANISKTDKITYSVVKDNLTDGNVTLYPVYEQISYDLRVAVWENYYRETDTLATTKAAFEEYMTEQGLSYVIEYRIYGSAYDAVADFGAAINADGDIDVILGSGANITSKGGVAVLDKHVLVSDYDPKDAGRQAALVTDITEAVTFYNFVTDAGYVPAE
ncbi:MAG: InlB B-repeat-containing protein, partial [Clostridia bacterium]|nr:InlB B-repeat-containing protein [Clostridia bacterium]